MPYEELNLSQEEVIFIKILRRGYSWRKIAEICHVAGVAGASWKLPNQLVGRALCKKASEILEESVDDQIKIEGEDKP